MDRLVYVYKSNKKLRSFLYIVEKDVFSHIPSGLMDAFGAPEFVMVFKLHADRKLQKISPEELSKALDEKGFFLRIDLQFCILHSGVACISSERAIYMWRL